MSSSTSPQSFRSIRSVAAAMVGAVRRGQNRRLVSMVLVVGVVMSAVLSMWLWNREQHAAELTMETRAEVLVNSVEDAISEVVARVKAVGGLHESSEEVTRDEFDRFVSNLGLIRGLGGIGFMPIVSSGEVAGFEAEMQRSIPGYFLFEQDAEGQRIPVGQRDEYVPVQWFEPFDAFGRPHGFDAMSEPSRRAAVDKARASGELASTPFLRLVSQEESDGFVLYWPVTDPAREAVVGFTVAAMDLSELLEGHLPERVRETVEWEITDNATDPAAEIAADGWIGSLDVGGRSWIITVVPSATSDLIPDPTNSLFVLIIGLLATVVTGAGASLYRQRSQTRKELEKLRELSRAKDQFLASVSHELRTPLTGVLGFAELLRDDHSDLSDTDRVSMISNIAAEAADLAAIIDDLLVAARSELDLLAVTRVPVAIRGQLAQVIEANSEFAARRVEIVADEEGTLRAIGDPQRVRQILRNLLSNAIEYGGERIQVRLQATDSNVRIQVADDGEGLPPSEWEQIFEPYHRAHAAGTKPASIGIGLSVARQLTQLMSGHLTYRREDNWSIFELRLPAASADAALTDVHRASSSPDLPPTTKTKEPATATTSPNG